jgi:hypothetical protein
MRSILKTKIIFKLVVTFFVLFFVCFQPYLAEEDDSVKVVEAIGAGQIYGDNLPAARELAISNALVSAVARISLEVFPLSSQIDHFQQVNEALYNDIDAYVQDYKVLTEFMSGKSYRALVQVTVMQNKIKAKLLASGLVVEEKSVPKILLFIAEENIGDILPNYWWGEDLVFVVPSSEEAMAQTLKDQRFNIIQHADITEPLNYDLPLKIEDAVTLGSHRAADIVVIGSAKAEKTSNVMGASIKSFNANVTVKAFRTDTGAEIAFATRTAVSSGVDEREGGRRALFDAGMLAGKDIAIEISSAWAKQNKDRKMVQIVVQGTSELINFVKFRQILGKINGVTAIHILEMKPNESSLTVDYDGTAQSLAEELMLNTFESFGIDIYEVLPGKLGIELIGG